MGGLLLAVKERDGFRFAGKVGTGFDEKTRVALAIREKTKIGEYLVADTVEALVGLAQMDILEIHTWNSRERLEGLGLESWVKTTGGKGLHVVASARSRNASSPSSPSTSARERS